GFEHNLHGLRIVDVLEYPYPSFPGLNLSSEVREAMALHSRRRDLVAEFHNHGAPLLEAQVADAADSLAYDAHDVDDALFDGLIGRDELHEVELCRRAADSIRSQFGELPPEQWQPTLIRTLIDWQVVDLLDQTERRLGEERIGSVADVRACPRAVVGSGPEM